MCLTLAVHVKVPQYDDMNFAQGQLCKCHNRNQCVSWSQKKLTKTKRCFEKKFCYWGKFSKITSEAAQNVSHLGSRPNVELFMRRTKLNELRSWKFRRLAQLSSSEWVWIVQHVLSDFFRRIERLKIVSGTNVDLYMRRTKLSELSSWKVRRLAQITSS